ncbi:MAG: signal peptidase II [Treponema sp.]|nr:signal peptidase II [Treponema sp.]
MESPKPNTYRPFLLSMAILIADQVTKALVVDLIPRNTIAVRAFGDFLWIVHARNTGIAFSMGDGLPSWMRMVLFSLLPLALIAGILIYYFRTDETTPVQRWALAAIVGGGLGNVVDRLFRPEGVVDFVSVKFYGLFGMERWPTFNVADSAVVLGALVVAGASFLIRSPGAAGDAGGGTPK